MNRIKLIAGLLILAGLFVWAPTKAPSPNFPEPIQAPTTPAPSIAKVPPLLLHTQRTHPAPTTHRHEAVPTSDIPSPATLQALHKEHTEVFVSRQGFGQGRMGDVMQYHELTSVRWGRTSFFDGPPFPSAFKGPGGTWTIAKVELMGLMGKNSPRVFVGEPAMKPQHAHPPRELDGFEKNALQKLVDAKAYNVEELSWISSQTTQSIQDQYFYDGNWRRWLEKARQSQYQLTALSKETALKAFLEDEILAPLVWSADPTPALGQGREVRVLGGLVATENCLKCHDAADQNPQYGNLLGALSYRLIPPQKVPAATVKPERF